MSSKRSFGLIVLVSVLLLAGLFSLFYGVNAVATKNAVAEGEISRPTNAASSVDACQYNGGDTAYRSNTKQDDEVDGYYKKIGSESVINSYTGALFMSSNKPYSDSDQFSYCYTDNGVSKMSAPSSSSEAKRTVGAANATFLNPMSNVFLTYDTSNYSASEAGNKIGVNTETGFFHVDADIPSSWDLRLNATFNLSQELCNAIADRLVTVKVTPYILTVVDDKSASYIGDNSKDSIRIECFCYNNGTIQHSNDRAISLPVETKMEMGSGMVLNPGSYTRDNGGNKAFLQVTLFDHRIVDSPSTVISEIGVQISVTPNTALSFDKESGFVIDGTDRNDKESTHIDGITYAKVGDVIEFDMKIKTNGRPVYLESADASAAGATVSGGVFHTLYSGASAMTIEYYLPDTNSGDMDVEQSETGNNSGQHARIVVKGGNSERMLKICVAIRYKELISSRISEMAKKEINIYVDSRTPDEPELNQNTFYSNYIDNSSSGKKLYYTASNEETRIMQNNRVVALDLGGEDNANDKLQFELSCLEVTQRQNGKTVSYIRETGGSDLTVYYKATFFRENYPTIQGEKTSDGIPDGFDVNSAELQSNGYVHYAPSSSKVTGSYVGIYCVATGEDDGDGTMYVDMEYGPLMLDLTYYNTSTSSIDYRQKGVWAIEFFAYDNVGNNAFSMERVFIRVDITEYLFTVDYFLGSGNYLGTLDNTDVGLYYEKLSISGEVGSSYAIDGTNDHTGAITLFRGDRVRLQINFDSESFKKYILTGFQVGGGAKKDCTAFVYRNNRALLDFAETKKDGTDDKVVYTFDVTDSLCKDNATRSLNLFFKGKISISATNLTQPYNGITKKITPYANYESQQLSINIATTYYTLMSDASGDYTVGETIGEYVYRTKNRVERISATITQDEQLIPATGVYESGVAYYKMLLKDDNSPAFPLHSGTFYCYCTVTTNANYYGTSVIIFTIRPGTPDLSSMYALKGNTQGQRIEIDYGSSLATIDVVDEGASTTSKNATKVKKFNENFFVYYNDIDEGIDTMASFISTDGIIGYFEIDKNYLDVGSDAYNKPSSGLQEISVLFTPVMFTVTGGGKAYTYDQGTREFIPNIVTDTNGYFIKNTDYETRTVTVLLYVRPSKDVAFSLEGSQMPGGIIDTTGEYERVVYTYNAGVQGIVYTVVSNYENEDGSIAGSGSSGKKLDLTGNTEVLYAPVSSMSQSLDDAAFSAQIPISAGLYAAKVSIIESNCNYSGQKVWYVLIEPVALNVSVTASVFDYQYETLPSVRFTRGAQSYSNLKWTYSFYYYDENSGYGLQETCTENNLVKTGLRPYVSLPVNAGTYVVKVEIDDNNYSGTGYAFYTIRKVGDLNIHAKKAWPYLNDSTIASGCHICYGQPLLEVRRATGSGYVVRYEYQVYDSATKRSTVTKAVTGEFFIAYQKYDEWLAEENAVDSVQNRNRYVVAMKNYYPDTNYNGYSWYMCFVASKESEEVDESVNFDFLYSDKITVKVGYAYIDWTKVVIDPVYYETLIAFRDEDRDAVAAAANTVNVAKKVGVLYSQNGVRPLGASEDDYYVVGRNVFRYADTEDYFLEFRTDNAPDYLYPAGTHKMRFGFIPNGTNNYTATEYDDCILTVLKKHLDVAVGNDSKDDCTVQKKADGTLETVYNYYSAPDSRHYFTYSTYFGQNGVTYFVEYSVLRVRPSDWDTSYRNYYTYDDEDGYKPNTSEIWGATDYYARIYVPLFSGRFIYKEKNKDVPATYVLNNTQYVVTRDIVVTLRDVRSVWTVQEPIRDSSGNLLYDDLGLVRTEIKRKEMQNIDVGRTYAVVDYVSVLPAGEYTVKYYIDDNDYEGMIEYDLTIKKATLVVGVDPSVADETRTLCYGKRASDLRFYGGQVTAEKNGEVVPGVFEVNMSSIIFGNYNTDVTIDYLFRPNDTDNYEIFYGQLGGKKVHKADISDQMELYVPSYVYGLGHTTQGVYYPPLVAADFFGEDNCFDGNGTNSIGKLFDFTAVVPNPTPSDDLTGKYHVVISGSSERELINSGSYVVTLSIDDDEDLNYCGTRTAVLNVLRDRAYIALVEDDDHDYVVENDFDTSGSTQSLTPVLYNSAGEEVSSTSIIQNFYRNGVSTQTPSAIGRYDLRMRLNSTHNYILVAAAYRNGGWELSSTESSYVMASLVIGVNKREVSFSNIVQTYSEQKTVSVDMGINDATCTLEYVRVENSVETGIRYRDGRFPTEAGQYNIHMMFAAEENNGYVADVIWDEPLLINKYTAKITCPSTVETSYTGREYEVFTPFTDPYGLGLVYYYSDGDEMIRLSKTGDLGKLDVGVYYVLIEISDNNYAGTREVNLIVNKADLTVTEQPVFGDYVYHSDVLPLPRDGKGAVYCPENGVADIAGVFSVAYDDISSLPVGVQTVTYSFIPDENDVAAKNYAPVKGKVKLNVVKAEYDMEYVSLVMNGASNLLVEADHTVEYNGDKFEFSALITNREESIYNYASDNSDFYISVSHSFRDENGRETVTSPRAIGTYIVTAAVVSDNYKGSKTWQYHLNIIKGEPEITEEPAVSGAVYIGSTVDTGDLIGGKASIKNKPSKKIDGSFVIEPITFTKANKNEIDVTFVPYDGELFNSRTFKIYVNVVGKDVFAMAPSNDEDHPAAVGNGVTSISGKNWTSSVTRSGYAFSRLITASFTYLSTVADPHDAHGVYIAISPKNGAGYLTYGAKLSDYKLEFLPCVTGCAECAAIKNELNNNGVLEFVDGTVVPNVDGSAEVRYSLYQDAGIEDQEQYNEMIGLIDLGDILRKVTLSAASGVELIGFIGKSLSEEGGYRLNVTVGGKSVETSPTAIEFSLTDVITSQNDGETVELTNFVSRNYQFASLPLSLVLNVYTAVSNADIEIARTTKVYDGKALSPSDLGLSVINTVMPVSEESFALIVLDEDRKTSQGIDIGVYTVVILLRDDEYGYYGEAETTFVIEKRDVSDLIRLTKNFDVYGSSTYVTSPGIFIASDPGSVLPSSEVSIKYRLAGSDRNFVSTVSVAGTYELRAIVNSENYYAEHIFEYVIRPQELTYTLDKDSYLFLYGNERSENRSISAQFSNGEAMEYVVYFQKQGYSRTTVVPLDAGEYSATIELVDKNYTLRANSFSYVIRAQSVTVEEQPAIQTQVDSEGNDYHIKYGTKLIAVNTKFVGGRAVIASGDAIEGKFVVSPADADKVFDAGTRAVTVLFVPDSTNYQTVAISMNIVIAKVEVVVEFRNLTAVYKGYSLANEIDYVVSGAEEEIPISFSFTSVLQRIETKNPIAAGSYEVDVTSSNGNYIIKTTTVYGGASKPVFVINKAAVDETRTIKPKTVPVSVGDSLMKSSLNDGQVYYNNFTNSVRGTYSFVQTARSFKTAGQEMVEYRFVPADGNNFDSYRGVVPITITRGTAVIHWSDVTVTYGEPADFASLRSMFTTTPNNLFYRVSTFDVRNNKMYDDSGDEPLYMNANTYTFTCWIEDDNYTSEVYRFNYIVEKKKIDIDFTNEQGSVVTAYNVLYAKSVKYGYKLYDSNDTTGRAHYLSRDAETINDNVQYYFTSRDEGTNYNSRVAPTALGSYTITVELIHENYTATASATYKIVKGTVEEINFDLDSLSGQTYGTVFEPIIITVPTDVKYYIIYQGYDRKMPTDVGSYNITVYVDDESYNSKQVSAVFKINPKPLTVSSYTVTDKIYDGTTAVMVEGKLSGILFGDEVSITMKGATADDSVDVGKHGVKIVEYKLTGLKAENYTLSVADCAELVEIKTATVRDKKSASYITSTDGFEEGTGISFYVVDTEQNKTNAATKAVGASATVIGYNITINGEPSITTGQYKICVQIPDEYKTTDFSVDFGNQTVLDPHREGDMYVFNTSVSSGQIVFSKATFKYTYLIIIIAAVIVVVGLVLLVVLNPMRKR